MCIQHIYNLTNNSCEMHFIRFIFFLQDSSLLKMVKKYLCVMATSVPCERVFSASGNIANCKRSCLLGEKLHKLLFLKSVDKTFWGHN